VLQTLLLLGLFGVILLISGIIYPTYVLPEDSYNISRDGRFYIAKSLLIKWESFLAPSKSSKLCKILESTANKLDVKITASRLWLYKIICLLVVLAILVMVSFTNISILKQNIMGSWWQENSFLNSISQDEYKYNVLVYKEVLSRIGEKNLKKLSDEERLRKVNEVLYDDKSNNQQLRQKTEAFLNAFQTSENVRVITVNLIIATIIAFFLPEIMLFLRKLILGKKYKGEAIKMENIFSLLGSIEDYKTIYIIKDMAFASKIFSKQLNHAATIFYTDKNKSFEYLKESVKERSFVRLVDTMRIYSTVDKKLAMSILERNLKEQEEQLLLSAEEDMDIVDILAFLSVVPIIYEVANLMLSPMLEVVFQAFNFM